MNDKKLIPMEELIVDSPSIFLPKPGSIVEGAVITVHNNRVLVDLGGVSTGIIAGREAVDSNNTVKSLLPGDEVSAFVL
jgi:ribosomal protein S1